MTTSHSYWRISGLVYEIPLRMVTDEQLTVKMLKMVRKQLPLMHDSLSRCSGSG